MKNFLAAISLVAVFVLSCSPAEHSEGLLELNGTELYVKSMGEGELLVVLHGGPGLGYGYFLPYLEPLAENHHMILYDQRLSGNSVVYVPMRYISLWAFLKDIDAIREYYGAEKVNLLAHSWGSLLAIEYALRYPDYVNKLILSNPTPLGPEYRDSLQAIRLGRMTPEFMQARDSIFSSGRLTERDVSAMEELYRLNYSITLHHPEDIGKVNVYLPDDFYLKRDQLSLFKGLDRVTYFDLLSRIKAPTLVLRGEHDISIREADQRAVDSLANGELYEFKESGHFPFMEQNEEFIRVVNGFLGDGN